MAASKKGGKGGKASPELKKNKESEDGAEKAKGATESSSKGKKVKERASESPRDILIDSLSLVKRGVSDSDPSCVLRALRRTEWVRKKATISDVRRAARIMGMGSENSAGFFSALDAAEKLRAASGATGNGMEVENASGEKAMDVSSASQKRDEKPNAAAMKLLPEVDAYLHILVAPMLYRSSEGVHDALEIIGEALRRANACDFRPTIGILLRRLYHAYSLCHEKLGRSGELRAELIAAHRTACLRLDVGCQATLINLVVRNFLRANMVDQAIKFSSKTTFPDNAPNNELVRNLYYRKSYWQFSSSTRVLPISSSRLLERHQGLLVSDFA